MLITKTKLSAKNEEKMKNEKKAGIIFSHGGKAGAGIIGVVRHFNTPIYHSGCHSF